MGFPDHTLKNYKDSHNLLSTLRDDTALVNFPSVYMASALWKRMGLSASEGSAWIVPTQTPFNGNTA